MVEKKNTKSYEKFISENEEIRCWFKVTTNRKKIRNIELWILEEIKKICKKYNINYYADSGTMLWAIRHEWFIPWDDDVDITMFRKDYEKFLKIAEKELPDYLKIRYDHAWVAKVMNIKTSALHLCNWREKDFIWGIRIDIFPIEYASKYSFINFIKSIIILSLRSIMLTQKSEWSFNKMKTWKKILIYPLKCIFWKIDNVKIFKLHEYLSKKVFFKWDKIYIWWRPYKLFNKNIFNKSHDVKFENTTICIPNWYDEYLKQVYGDYTKPVIRPWGHNCWYSVDKTYKDIIKTFDKSKSNEENYNNCKDLFVL